MYEHIKVINNNHGLAWIFLDRPQIYNAFNDEMMDEISSALKYLENNTEVKVLAITGNGKAFASGADIESLQKMTQFDALFPKMQDLYNQIYKFTKPTIAAVNGYALGGGLELAIACDIRVCSTNSKFSLPECKLGVIPGAGGTQRLVKILGEAKVKELVFLGRVIIAEEALRLGLVTDVVELERLEEKVQELFEVIIQRGPLALRLAKTAINLSDDISLEVGLMIENLSQAYLFGTEDKKEGVNAYLEKRKPNFQGK
ncbi:MAG: hypothetical protein JM58_15620 [Peptococcaceae bacterium BICA1-8]|nr:MAG: hypothetical protein JM58_15620 [Peptococcaceae bacterium BICA1-8]